MTGDDEKKDVLNFHSSLVKKLQSDLTSARQAQDDITRGSRLYWQRVQAVHQAVLMLLENAGPAALPEAIQHDLAPRLGLEAVQLLLSPSDGRLSLPLMRPVPPAFQQAALRDVLLIEDPALLEQLFPGESGLLAAALAFPLTGEGFQGVLALGMRDAAAEAGLAHEPFIFLARVIERLVAQCQRTR